MGKAVPFQMAWRGFLGRRALNLLREEKDMKWHAAVRLQRAWYRLVAIYDYTLLLLTFILQVAEPKILFIRMHTPNLHLLF